MSDKHTMYVATDSFITRDSEGNDVTINRGTSLFWGDHELVKRFPQNFKESPDHARPDVESATKAPGERRGRKRATTR